MVDTTDNLGFNAIKQISRYEIGERIGTGGMARVYRATDKSLERDVAIKILHDHLADDDMFRQRFEREAKFIASLNHPNIVQIYDYATIEMESKYFCYMVMTYLPRQTLKDIMDQNVEQQTLMPHEQVLRIIKDIAAALDYAHHIGMVHRDVKPANILFNEQNRAVLTDFGIARLAEGSKLTQDNVAIGTPAYMAPEQAAGEQVDARTDIYALGIILYELLAGKSPYGDDGSISVLLRHINEPIPTLTQYAHIQNDYLDLIVQCALAKASTDRYQTAGELAHDLEQALKGTQPSTASKKKSLTNTFQQKISGVVPPIKPVNSRYRNTSPLGILVVGLGIMVVILASAFFISENAVLTIPTLAPPPAPTERPTLDPDDFRRFGGIDSMVGEQPAGAASMTSQLNVSFMSDFSVDDPLVGTYWALENPDDSVVGEISRTLDENGNYVFVNRILNRAATTIMRDYYYTNDMMIIANITLSEESPINSGYGIVFHHVDENNHGVFAIDGAGRYSIWFLENRVWRELRNLDESWTANAAINNIGENNELRLEIQGMRIAGYVNNELVVEVEDNTITEGGIGIYLATPNSDNSGASVLIDSYEVAVVGTDTVSSMTGDDDTQEE